MNVWSQLALLLGALLTAMADAQAGEAKRIKVTGEFIDTWCYYSGVMGGKDSVIGSAHHTCAMWCAAGGIPVGLLTDDGDVYMVLKLNGIGTGKADENLLKVQSNRLTADGRVYERDGLKYIVVEKVIANEGITNRSHEDFGVIPPIVIPELNK